MKFVSAREKGKGGKFQAKLVISCEIFLPRVLHQARENTILYGGTMYRFTCNDGKVAREKLDAFGGAYASFLT